MDNKLIEYLASAFNVVSVNPWLGPLQRIIFFPLSACTEELLSTPDIMTFLPNPLPSDCVLLSCYVRVLK